MGDTLVKRRQIGLAGNIHHFPTWLLETCFLREGITFQPGLAVNTDRTTLRKNHWKKFIVAAVVKRDTSIKNQWLAVRLHLGHDAGMCRNLGELMQDPSVTAIITRYGNSIK